MNIGIIGDTHRNYNYIDKAIDYLMNCDLIFHTGDNFSDSIYINKLTGIDIIAVKGNCDLENVEEEIFFTIKNYNIFITHGHKYNVKYSMDILKERAKNLNADIVVFGHNHTYKNEISENILYLNPGSLHRPNGDRSFLLLNIEDNKTDIKKIIL